METVENRMDKPQKRGPRMPDQTYEIPTCRNCGSHRVRTTKSEPVTPAARQRHHRCQNCGAYWDSLEAVPKVDRKPADAAE